MNTTDIIAAAMESGFMLSTAHGQGEHQMMPASDLATIVAFARAIERLVREEGRARMNRDGA